MSISSRMRNIKAHPVTITKSPAQTGTQAKLFTEEGWIFREQPGKGVECIRRDDEAQTGGVNTSNPVRNRYRKN